MEKYLVSARKYRPSTFASVVGQKALVGTLKNAVASNRLAHSYLFCGSRGVGKTTCARIFAKTINCEHPTPEGEACNECTSCRSFNDGTSMNIVELDAASHNGVQDIRELVEQVQMRPREGSRRVFIIDEVHMLSNAAFNAFLKTLEEPPEYVIFILATTEKHKIIPTILSRCQIYDFHRITIQDMIDHMAYVAQSEGITAETAALGVIARKADGAMRDALSIFDQVAASSAGNITYQSALDSLNVLDYEYYNKLLDAFMAGDVLRSWSIYKEIRDRGFDSLFFINGLGSYMRDLMVSIDPSTQTLLEAGDEAKAAMAATASRCTPQFLYQAMYLCNEADLNYRTSSNKQFLIELTLARLCQPAGPSRSQTDGNSSVEGQLQPIIAVAPVTSATSQASQALSTPQISVSAAPKQPAPAPRPTPRPQPLHSPSTQRTPSATIGGTPRISIRLGASKTTSPASAGTNRPHVEQKRTQPFSDEKLYQAWDAYTDAHPKEHILTNTMRASRPQRIEGTAFELTVQNQHQLQTMESHMPALMQYLHDTLSNDTITISITLSQGEGPRHTLSDQELLDKMRTESPILNHLVESLNLRLS